MAGRRTAQPCVPALPRCSRAAATAARRAAAGEDVILVRAETTPDDLEGMIAARGILTSRGGKTSHAAVVARGMGKTCVCGAESLVVDVANRSLMVRGEAGHILHEGDVISIDGSTGEVFEGAVDVVPSPVVDFFEGRTVPDEGAAEVVRAVARIMAIADVYDALVSDRVYKAAIPHAEAVRVIASERGRHFDPALVDVFLEIAPVFQDINSQFSNPA